MGFLGERTDRGRITRGVEGILEKRGGKKKPSGLRVLLRYVRKA